MKPNIKYADWEIIEENFNPDKNEVSESIFSIANGKMGHRANFEEFYSGRTLQGNYIAGIYYPDKPRTENREKGHSDFHNKIINAPDWRGIKITIAKNKLDLFKCKISEFKRVLNMKHGYLHKQFIAEIPDGKKVKVESFRFLSIVNDELGAIKYSITPLNFSDEIQLLLDIDADVSNKDSNYGEKFWTERDKSFVPYPYIVAETKKTFFNLCTAMNYSFEIDGEEVKPLKFMSYEHEKYIGYNFFINIEKEKTLTIFKYVAVTSSLFYAKDVLIERAFSHLEYATDLGFDALLNDQKLAWNEKWENVDVKIDGNIADQQAVRFNMFNLLQTYTGKDEHFNISPKGFTGEKYGGLTYWDFEIFCMPFYLSNSVKNIAQNFLKYRYEHLLKAIENAEKIGFTDGAALFPMATINGEESHRELGLSFEEIHRNGAIAYAMFYYVNYTGDTDYLSNFGLEVLIAISRFWKQRINFSECKQKFVLLGVTSPNEYENNVNNNWYTSKIAVWTLKYTIEVLKIVESKSSDNFIRICETTSFDEKETEDWQNIIDNMYLPYDDNRQIFLQQDGFLDKQLVNVDELNPKERPLFQNWSPDRISRSCFIKHADVVQGLFLFENQFDIDTIKRNFNFYEPMTVHESSLSASMHSIVASKIKDYKKAYNYFYKSSRLDLNNYNNEVKDGLHISSMGGSWMSVVYGFGGMRIIQGKLSFSPFLPEKWNSFSFKIIFRTWKLEIVVKNDEISVINHSNTEIDLFVFDNEHKILSNDELTLVGI